MMKWLVAPCLILTGAHGALAQAQAVPAGTIPSKQTSGSYTLGPNDEIEITVFKQPDMSVKTRVKADGTISVPFLENVQAAGQTTSELASALASRYMREGLLNRTSINVEVTAYASKVVTVLGAVQTAGLYALDRSYTVAEMVGRAGGTRPDGANAVILTPAADGTPVRISLLDMTGGAARVLRPGDGLFVPAAEQVFVYGEVNKGGGYPYQPNMTYRQALALAGGPTLAGSTRKIEVRRGGKRMKVQLDDPAQPDDVLFIREKLF